MRDPYTHKPYVHFYITKRVGGMLQDSQAVKILKTSQ
ncbi:phage major capsid protein [Ventosimonas gracilis]|nr:phage major capsid protein [Ventosimonas gracilis]